MKPKNRGYVFKLQDTLHGGMDDGRIPVESFRACGPDFDNDRILIAIYPDDVHFRAAVAALLPAGGYEIRVEDIRGHG